MRRCRAALLGVVVLVAAFSAAQVAQAGYTAIVIDTTNGTVLYERGADTQKYPASLTKMMTIYMVFDAIEQGEITMDTEWTVSSRASQQPPSKLGLSSGSTITVRNAVMALMTKSANDVATVVAEGMSGTEWQFAQDMTDKARDLGMTRTQFGNASGLPDESMVSTARDMATLAMRLQDDFPQYYDLFSTTSFTYNGQTYGNHNKLLGVVDGVDGLKTGYTRAAGWNLAASAMRDDRRIVAIIMGGKSRIWRDERMKQLIGEGYVIAARLDLEVPLPDGHPLREQPIMVASADAAQVPAATLPATPMAVTEFSAGGVPYPKAHPTRETMLAGAFSIDNIARAIDGSETPLLTTAQGSAEETPWAMQVGAYSQFENAYQAIDTAEFHLRDVMGEVAAVVTSSETEAGEFYRARFVGLSEDQAREGCQILMSRNLPCAVVRFGL
ncbi:MAG: D-alanyl-D-alanine carboxypeptidase family protein [Pseudomonadota bacterium]